MSHRAGELERELRRTLSAEERRFESERASLRAEVDEARRRQAEAEEAAGGLEREAERLQQALREEAVRRELARRREQAAIMAREQALAKQRAEAAQRKAAAEAAEREALEPELRNLMHTRVQIGGLSAKPELNGKCGRTTAYNREKGRFAVAIEGGPSMLLKPANLTAVHDPDAGPPPLE